MIPIVINGDLDFMFELIQGLDNSKEEQKEIV